MPRKYVSKPGSRKYGYCENDMQLAIDDVNQGRLSITKAAAKYKISKGSLVNRLKGRHIKKRGRPLVFTEEEENVFVSHIIEVAKWGFPFDTTDLRQLAKMYLDKSGKKIKEFGSNNLPSKEWAWRFIQRHKNKISNRMCQNIVRAKAAVTPEQFKAYFNNLKETLNEISDDGADKYVPPERIYNYDETNLSDDPGAKKCIFKRGVKYADRIKDTSKTSISVMYCGSASGNLLPPYVVYKSSHLWQTWMENGPPNTCYNRSLSGWFDSTVFEDWFGNFFIPHTRKLNGKVVLIGDNLSSHFSKRVIELAHVHNVAFVCIPPHSTHIAQPLDVAFYAPLKKYWRKILDDWKSTQKRKAQVLSKEAFPSLLKLLHFKIVDENNVSSNLVSGFRKCGIFPFEPNEVISRLPRNDNQDIINEGNVAKHVSEAVLEMLEKSRSNTPCRPSVKRRKVKVVPGRGITLEELQTQSLETGNKNSLAENNSMGLNKPTASNKNKPSKQINKSSLPEKNSMGKENIPSTSTGKRERFRSFKYKNSESDASITSANIPYMDTSEGEDGWESSDEELYQQYRKT